jgi:hypothetical protein
MHTLFIKRDPRSINNVFTLQELRPDGQVIEHFKRLPGRSGQRRYEGTCWVPRKSPIPYGEHWLWTEASALQMTPVGTPFFPICSDRKTPRIILDPANSKHRREDVGLHFENEFAGSLGCEAALKNLKSQAMFEYLENLHEAEPWIRVRVL